MATRSKRKTNYYLVAYHLMDQALGPQHWWPGETPEEIVTGAILTQNTAWSNVEKAIANLKSYGLFKPGGGLADIKKILLLPKKKLARLIRPSGYFNIKALRLQSFFEWLIRNYGSLEGLFSGDLSATRASLLKAPGVGPETADSILLYAGGKPTFVIDAYTRRIFTRHMLATEDDAYHQLKDRLEKNLPSEVPLYNQYHALLVNIGKNFCRKSKPLCDRCPLNGFRW